MMLERDCWFISNPQFGREGLAMLRVLSKVAAAMLPDGASHHSWDGQVAKDTRQSTLQEQQYRLLGSSAVEGTGLGTALEATTTSRICVQTLHTTQEESKVASVKEEQETSASITWDLGCCHNRQPKEEERQLADVKPEIETPTEAKLYTSPETQSSMRPPSTEVKPCIEVKRERTPSSQQGDKSKRRRTAFKVNKSHIRSLISTPFS